MNQIKEEQNLVEEGFQEFIKIFGPNATEQQVSVLRSVWFAACLWTVADENVNGSEPVSAHARFKHKREAEKRKASIMISAARFAATLINAENNKN